MTDARLELAAMQAIADALSALPDADARTRVLKWVSEHFRATERSSVVAFRSRRVAPDEENLHSLFDEGDSGNEGTPRMLGPAPVPSPPAAPARTSVVADLESLVEDFQQLAREWQSA